MQLTVKENAADGIVLDRGNANVPDPGREGDPDPEGIEKTRIGPAEGSQVYIGMYHHQDLSTSLHSSIKQCKLLDKFQQIL